MDLLRFVDSITAAPSLRLDLNDGVTWGLRYEGTDLSPPPLRQSWSGTLLADGELQSAAAYANRRIRLNLDLITASVDAAAAQMQALWRELNRPSNVLMWQPEGASQAVFFRTLRSSDTQVTEFPGAGGLRAVAVEIAAEPFGYGVKEILSTVTINNDPAAGSNGCYFDVAAASCKGDAETPLHLSFDPTNLIQTGRKTSVLAVRRRGTPSAAPFVLQAESMTVGSDTTVQPNDAVMSGAGSNYVRTTFAVTAAMAGRLSASPFPSSPSVDVTGTYRVFARVRRSVGGSDVVQMRLKAGDNGYNATGDTVTVTATTQRQYVDLGALQIPLGAATASDGYSGTPLAARGMTISVEAARTSGTTNLDIDVLLFVPADDRLCLIKWTQFGGPTALVVDGAAQQVYAVGASGEVRTMQPAEIAGGLPMISPNQAARVYLIQDVTATAGSDDKTTSVQVTPYYWPRYLYVRPATS